MSWRSQWYQFLLILMFLFKVKTSSLVIGLADLIEINHKKYLCGLWTGRTVRKYYSTRRNLAVLIAANTILRKIQKILQMRIWHPWMSQLPTTAERWSAVVSFMVASPEMALSELNVGKKINLWRFSTWINFVGFSWLWFWWCRRQG